MKRREFLRKGLAATSVAYLGIARALRKKGYTGLPIEKILGDHWVRMYTESLF